MGVDFREAWAALIARRPAFRSALAPYHLVLDAWASWTAGGLAPVAAGAEECRDRWRGGVPLAAAFAAAPPAAVVEGCLDAAIRAVLTVGPDWRPALERLVEAWDAGAVGPAALMPGPGSLGDGSVERLTGLPAAAVGVLASAALRPALEHGLGPCRVHLGEGDWEGGICPFCGGPPAFSEISETGSRLLVCHLCGGTWPFGRFVCPGCRSERSGDLARLTVEGDPREEGYAVAVCGACRTYVKELDRRTRWNAGPALVEDWGSPHLDLVAVRAGYRRRAPTLLMLSERLSPEHIGPK